MSLAFTTLYGYCMDLYSRATCTLMESSSILLLIVAVFSLSSWESTVLLRVGSRVSGACVLGMVLLLSVFICSEKRRLVIPAGLAYGNRGAGDLIPAGMF